MSMGERTPVALLNGPASGRLAVAEAVTNLLAAPVEVLKISSCRPTGCARQVMQGDDAVLYDTVAAVGREFCPALGITIPVGKDSMSMRTVWEERARIVL